ncbi:hypothetical protein MKX01_002578 [Papaver californicum]|nr:hypothetical protein MKX01_002578 [Papaver californicum]
MVNDSDGKTSEQPKKMGSFDVNAGDPTILEAPAAVPPPEADVENQASLTEISSILRRQKKENLLDKGSLFLRGGTLFFHSFLSYCLAISILAITYCGAQAFHQINRIRTGKEYIPLRKAFIVDFFGDQASAISMIFFAFLPLALSALISGFKLSNQNYF